ncbi:MAG: bifunctional lysylphosphatidylglycerol flippase/synthetase MprF [Streptococcaceae bacterium]|jgi:phosphatidylglycerol lysyltransferase|nr:bifunctional lysylphosphatidylglycerol flippase/synthetase MprF [Streptococcaceae bacterium]
MKTIIHRLRQNLKTLKKVFVLTVFIIAFYELSGIFKTLNSEKLNHILDSISPSQFILLIFLGIIAITPMLIYDLVINKELDTHLKKQYIIETSFLINTLNNLIGFGGLIGTSLRAHFYGNQRTAKEMVQTLSKLLLFEMSGLSLLSAATLLLVFTPVTNSYFFNYWPWLLGGALYFPCVLAFSHFSQANQKIAIQNTMKSELTLASFLEWFALAGLFVIIGWMLGFNIHLGQLIVLYIASIIIGLVSMIPGGLGSFDVMIILGLEGMGITPEEAAVWLLIYRLTYYIIPVLLALIVFIRTTFKSTNEKYNNIPKALLSEFAHKLAVSLLYILGILLVLSAAAPTAFEKIKWLHKITPWGAHTVLTIPKLVMGFLLLIVAHAILVKVKRAFIPSIVLLLGTLNYILVKSTSLIPIFSGNRWFFIYYQSTIVTSCIIGLAILLIIISRGELYREQLVLSSELFLKDGLIFIILILFYVLIGVYNHPSKHHHLIHTNFWLFPSEKLWLTGFIVILIIAAFISLLLFYLQGKRQTIGEAFDIKKIEQVLSTYGGNQQSHLIFLQDKELYFYYQDGNPVAFLQFKRVQDKLIVMGNPSGNYQVFQPLIKAFVKQADCFGYIPIFYEVTKNQVMFLHELGFQFFKMGEEGHVTLEHFSTSGKKNRTKRSLVNQVEKAGFTMTVIHPPFSSTVLNRLKEVSDDWLDGRSEKGFSLGFFNEEYLSTSPIAIVKNEQDEIEAFATIMPSYQGNKIISVDLMRYSKKSPKGIMDYLFISLFEYYKAQGFEKFDLGMAPLSNVGISNNSYTFERLAHLIYQFGSKIYSFQGLRAYKDKYANTWVSRYTLYPRNKSIIFTIFALLAADKK